MAKRVLVTGSAGYFGAALTQALAAHPLVRRVVGVDTRAPAGEAGPKVRHCQADIRDGVYLRSILEEEEIDTVFHLAFLMGEFPQRMLAHSLNVEGALAVAEAANKATRVVRLAVASTVAVYGARPGNPARFSEDAPLRARWPAYAAWKRRAEEELGRLQPELRPDLQLSILRVCTLASEDGRLRGPVPFLDARTGVSLWLRDCPVQVLAEKDFLRVMTRIIEVPEFRGRYNVVPDDQATPAELSAASGRPHMRVPGTLLWLGLLAARWLRPGLGLGPGAVAFLAYPVVADNGRIKKALGIEFSTGTRTAFLGASRGSAAASPAPARDLRATI